MSNNAKSDNQPSRIPIVPLHSEAEMTREMQRPEYHRDPAFREHVRKRISVSNLWSVWGDE